MGTNVVTLYRRPTKKLELAINGIVVKSDFTSNNYDNTTKSEINDVILGANGQSRLSGSYTDASSGVTYYTGDTNDSFDGTNQVHISYIDEVV